MSLVIWIDPASAEIVDPIYHICTKETAIAMGYEMGERNNHVYEDDEEALADFMIVHWAWFIEPSELEHELST